jgi:hypothetical protein
LNHGVEPTENVQEPRHGSLSFGGGGDP